MTSLPSALRVPCKDVFSPSQFTSTKYRLQGRVHLAGAVLVIEWRGTAASSWSPASTAYERAASFHEVVTDTAGAAVEFRGYFSAVAERSGAGWKLRNAHWSLVTGTE